MPYRELPRRVVARADDPPSVTAALALRDRFSRLDPATLWPAPAENPFGARSIDTLSVSADGTRALITCDSTAWMLDTATMIASAPIALPESLRQCALNDDGTRAALITRENALYRWDVTGELGASAELEEVWRSEGLYSVPVLELSRDGRVAVACNHDRHATVRVFDLDARTLTYSFAADTDECVALHPGGRHLICFGDDGVARIYGRTGFQTQINLTAGGAISRDGEMLICSSLNEAKEVRLFALDASGTEIEVGPERQISLGFGVERWNAKARFSPSGRLVLVSASSGYSHLIDLDASTSRPLRKPMVRRTAIIAGETLALSPSVSARDFGVSADGVAVLECEAGAVRGILCVASGSRQSLVAITALGLHGGVEPGGLPIGEEVAPPYERPALMSQILSNSSFSLERDEQLHLDEVRARRAGWTAFVSSLTADISLRQLMAINRGLLEMTGEIVARAHAGSNDEGTPRFGPPQVNLGALEVAAAKLVALPPAGRDEVFSQFIERLRREARGGPDVPDATPRPAARLALFDAGEDGLLLPPVFGEVEDPFAALDEPTTALVAASDGSVARSPLIATAAVSGALVILAAVIYLLISLGG